MRSPVRLIRTRRFGDDRGWFSETYHAVKWAEQGVTVDFVQDNHSMSVPAGTIRGIHFQIPPHAQDKLVRCPKGRIIDFAVDLRRGSPTYGRYVATELSEENGLQMFVPIGFGHAFITLEPNSEVIYKVSDIYAPEAERGIRWDDPDIAIDWSLDGNAPTLSAKDQSLPGLNAFDSPFDYDGVPLGPLED
jgi:dTDP-4-dehydrorhamnose 3,5-epimerase